MLSEEGAIAISDELRAIGGDDIRRQTKSVHGRMGVWSGSVGGMESYFRAWHAAGFRAHLTARGDICLPDRPCSVEPEPGIIQDGETRTPSGGDGRGGKEVEEHGAADARQDWTGSTIATSGLSTGGADRGGQARDAIGERCLGRGENLR
ncbi:hypothetical protein BD413DRAFT_311369 [Trametes elegans]|nr:hypothetical protein BD413DRAFT_311369 [Trametes elegans]